MISLVEEIFSDSRSIKDAKACLTDGNTDHITFKNPSSKIMAQQLNFTDRQAQAILEMRLYKLIGLEIEALMKEHSRIARRNLRDAMRSPETSRVPGAQLIRARR